MGKLKNAGCLVTVLAAVIGSVKSCQKINQKLNDWQEVEIREPKKDDFRNYNGVVLYPYLSANPDKTVNSFDAYIIDEDGDGKADLIYSMGRVYWIAEGYKPERFSAGPQTKTMTAEMRDLATEVLKADQRLSYLLAKKTYEWHQKEKEKR
ncbi:hypothetical protein HY485_03205 [Candidatus Woesearchaeota archaeon]|nr:hypothetical protein [Candidatus Woesearchaeota archaeon]